MVYSYNIGLENKCNWKYWKFETSPWAWSYSVGCVLTIAGVGAQLGVLWVDNLWVKCVGGSYCNLVENLLNSKRFATVRLLFNSLYANYASEYKKFLGEAHFGCCKLWVLPFSKWVTLLREHTSPCLAFLLAYTDKIANHWNILGCELWSQRTHLMFIDGLLAAYTRAHLLGWHHAGTHRATPAFWGKERQPWMAAHRQDAECFKHHFFWKNPFNFCYRISTLLP